MINFKFVDVKWSAERFIEALKRIFVLPFYKIPSNTPDRYHSVTIRKGIKIPMRDGIRLNTNIYRPHGAGRFPVVMTRMPYGINEMYCFMHAIGKFWAKKGYVFVGQDTRGRFESEGEWDPFVHEIDDSYDTLEWISKQPWCDGNIGATGESYYGYTTWAAALSDHPNLKCIAPSTTSMDIHGVWIFNNGAFCLQTMGTWAISMNAKRYKNRYRLDYRHLPLMEIANAADIPCDYYEEWIQHPKRDEYWDRINLDQRYNEICIPTLHLGGWYDTFLKSTIDDWQGVRKKSDDILARENQWLVIGPIDHEGTTNLIHRVGRVDVGKKSEWFRWDISEQFFDCWLKGIENGFDKSKRVKLFVIGVNDWIEYDDWPLPETEFRQYFFHSEGDANSPNGSGLLDEFPPNTEQSDRFIYDPNKPVSLSLEMDLWHLAETMQDRSEVAEREDVLVYTSKPIDEDMQITGPIKVKLYAASSAMDTDFTAALVDVSSDGYCHLIQEGIVRARFHDPTREPHLIEPGRIYCYDIDLWSTSYLVRVGHSIRIELSSSNFNRYDRNLNTGNQFGDNLQMMVATQTIYHSTEFPSHLILPVIPKR